MLRNRDLKFHCEHVWVRTEQTDTPFTARASRGQVLKLPIAHGEGNYFAEPDVINELESTGRVVFRYCDAAGTVTDASNPNGSLNNIAGICNEARNVVGLMPHPERACEAVARQRRRTRDVRVGHQRSGRAGRAPERVTFHQI